MTAVVAASENLLRALVDEHATALLAFVTRLTRGDRDRAEEIVQETLIRAWRHPSALDPARGAVRPWLYTVARRLAIDDYRARRARVLEADIEHAAAAAVPDGVDEALQAFVLQEALQSLTEEHRAVLVETYYLGRPVNDAARVLGIPPGTVKSRSYYALRALRLALQERGVTA